VTSPDSVSAFAQQLSGKKLDLLLNVAGVMSPPQEDALETTNLDVLQRTFAVNTFGPLLLTQALLTNIEQTAKENGTAKVGIVSSRVGSVGDNSTGGSYAYRSSKAAVVGISNNAKSIMG
jgi:NAD(P)-dependent dehydrogenase (short-subunit alcohol dehydrogenase family)